MMCSKLKKNKLFIMIGLLYIGLLLVNPGKALEAFNNSIYYLKEMFIILPVIFLLTVAIEALIPKSVIIKSFGKNSGLKGNFLAFLLGSLSAGPIYAAFPIGKTLLSKGASISNIVIILSSWAVIKVPMLANEAKFLGVDFMLIRWLLTVVAILLMAYITAFILKKKELQAHNDNDENTNSLMIKQEYCIGCGLCVRMLPEMYKMKEGKAVVAVTSMEEESVEEIHKTVQKCPVGAIQYTSKIEQN
ncbi:permease [Mobilitalea sibirica]|uniref:Permease n=1 Tax=Mobilitalea sibirica TaxID=1462919 RepID=A0A8J7KU81_9FIRM|nr:permease [Mobilitalea sibirica]MBH1942186.1 permease [Mobilitalea sibirica]